MKTDDILKRCGLKNTPARRLILDIFRADIKPVDAEGVIAKLKGKRVNAVTVYRTLSSFQQAGIVKRIDLRRESVYYELADHHHHHLICTGCGVIEDFEICDVEDIAKTALKKSFFKSVTAHSFELFGTCKKCAKA